MTSSTRSNASNSVSFSTPSDRIFTLLADTQLDVTDEELDVADEELAARIVGQFSHDSSRSDIWHAFDLFLPTAAFLNLGYSRWYQTHLLGSPQRRLVERIVGELLSVAPMPTDGRVLDVGCGRGGGSIHVARTWGFDVVGVDLVPYNVSLAREHAESRRAESTGKTTRREDASSVPSFVVGDATRLPFERERFEASIAVDALVYMPDKRAVFEEIARVLVPGGVCVVSDLLVRSRRARNSEVHDQFTDAWDMSPLWTLPEYRSAIADAGLQVVNVTDLTSHSVGGFRKWTSLFSRLVDGPLWGVYAWALFRLGLDPDAVYEQARAAHEILPSLQHVLFGLQKPAD